jgi:hypothetical protein
MVVNSGENSGRVRPVPNLAGYRRMGAEGSADQFQIPVDSFKTKICRGRDFRSVAKLLRVAGYLLPDREGKLSQSVRIPGKGTLRCYVISGNILSSGDGEG